MPPRTIKVGTRGSKLALAQTDSIISLLTEVHPDISFEKVVIRTHGDDDRQTPLEKLGGVGVFTKALQSALLEGQVDLAVHSAKDLPSQDAPGLTLAAVPIRGPHEDALVSASGKTLDELSTDAVVGTGSPRRRAQLLHYRDDLEVSDIRGNVPTRLEKLKHGQYDAIIMAHAGLSRLGLDSEVTQMLPLPQFLPAPGQGFLAVETRSDNDEVLKVTKAIDDPIAHRCLGAERLLLTRLNAGCSAAIGGWCRIESEKIVFSSVVLDREGKKKLSSESENPIDAPIEKLVDEVTKQLLSQGAAELIREQDG